MRDNRNKKKLERNVIWYFCRYCKIETYNWTMVFFFLFVTKTVWFSTWTEPGALVVRQILKQNAKLVKRKKIHGQKNQNYSNKQRNSVYRMNSIFFSAISKYVVRFVIHYQYNANDKCRVLHSLISLLDILKGLAHSRVEVSKMVFVDGRFSNKWPAFAPDTTREKLSPAIQDQTRDLAQPKRTFRTIWLQWTTHHNIMF